MRNKNMFFLLLSFLLFFNFNSYTQSAKTSSSVFQNYPLVTGRLSSDETNGTKTVSASNAQRVPLVEKQNTVPKRALWVWNINGIVNDIINDTGASRLNLFTFCNNPHGDSNSKIEVLFLDVGDAISYNMENLRDFLSTAHDLEMTVEFLGGDPTWATYNTEIGIQTCNKIIEFNNSGDRSEKFDGIQFDVEPYILTDMNGYNPPYWNVDQLTVWNSFIAFLDSCQTMINNSGSELDFGIAIPRWYDIVVGVNQLHQLQDIVGYTAIMDYTETSASIIADAQTEIDYANQIMKKVWIGVETGDVYPESEWGTFFNEDVTYMEGQLKKVEEHFKEDSSFMGIAIHHYLSYMELKTDVDDFGIISGTLPSDFKLQQNYPNPFNPETKIEYAICKPGFVVLKIYNQRGQEVRILANELKSAGNYFAVWDGKNDLGYELPGGIYFCKLNIEEFKAVKKIIKLK